MSDGFGWFVLVVCFLALIGATGAAGKLDGQATIAKQCAFDGAFQVGDRRFTCQHVKPGGQ